MINVPLLEDLLDLLLGLNTGIDLGESLGVDDGLHVNIDRVASGHDVGEVDELDEGLDARTLQDLLLRHSLGDLERVILNSGNETVSEGALAGTLIEGLDHDGLLTGITSGKDDDNFTSLDAVDGKEKKGNCV